MRSGGEGQVEFSHLFKKQAQGALCLARKLAQAVGSFSCKKGYRGWRMLGTGACQGSSHQGFASSWLPMKQDPPVAPAHRSSIWKRECIV